MPRSLSVNLDHVATLRQVRRTRYPQLATAAGLCELAGAEGITLHLRGDRRHIQDRDLDVIRTTSLLPMTFEMAPTSEMLEIALRIKPRTVTLVPERPEELTTEGGLRVDAMREEITRITERLKAGGIRVLMFIEPEETQLRGSKDVGADGVELHTGRYALLGEEENYIEETAELERIRKAAEVGQELGLMVNAGHGLHYQNVQAVAAIPGLQEFSIGHGIVSRAVLVGMERAVREMRDLIRLN
jgi:pyridoxine 5-phosphate synthase